MTGNNIAVVIPLTEWNEWSLDCLRACDRQSAAGFEIWILPDTEPSPEWKARLDAIGVQRPLHIEPTGPANPARKRNVAMRKSGATVFALVDSDAYPREDWLANGLSLLTGDVGVVTGPNVTPREDEVSRRAAGRVMESPLGFGTAYIRHTPVPRQIVREMPTCNMIFRAEQNLYFREDLDTGEDMMFCADMRARGKQVLYDPDVVVYHHRRRLFTPFMRQFYRYGLDKPRLSGGEHGVTYLWQTLPALLVIYLVGLLVLNVLPIPSWLRGLSLIPLLFYMGALCAESIRQCKTPAEFCLAVPAFTAGHISYGWGYLVGWFRRGTRSRPSM